MATLVEVKVPDIGDFQNIPIIEVFVKAGDTITAEAPLISLESDKATMEVPSAAAGTVSEVKVKVGDKVAEGSLILTLATGVQGAAREAPPEFSAASATATPSAALAAAAAYAGNADIECEMLVLGAGPGGYAAAFRSAKAIIAAGSHAVKLPFIPDDPRVVVGTHAGDLVSEVCLAVEMGCDPTDIGKTIHPHPTLGESIGMAAEMFEGVCTDLPPAKRK